MTAISWTAALLLGLVQGLTEFFPVSSSAHLQLVQKALHVEQLPLLFPLSCHLGTLIALLFALRKEIILLFTEQKKTLLLLTTAMIPLVPAYLLFKTLDIQTPLLGLSLMATGIILTMGSKIRVKKKKGIVHDVLMIGVMQSAALVPGISRSASTISCARVLGWEAKEAVRFSFLLSIPTVAGGTLLEGRKLTCAQALTPDLSISCLIGFTTAFVVGLLVVGFAIRLLEKGRLQPFAWYCLGIGALAALTHI